MHRTRAIAANAGKTGLISVGADIGDHSACKKFNQSLLVKCAV